MIKVRITQESGHTSVRLLSGHPEQTLAGNGLLNFLPEEWKEFRELLRLPTMIPEIISLLDDLVEANEEDGFCLACGTNTRSDFVEHDECPVADAARLAGRLRGLKQKLDIRVEEG